MIEIVSGGFVCVIFIKYYIWLLRPSSQKVKKKSIGF